MSLMKIFKNTIIVKQRDIIAFFASTFLVVLFYFLLFKNSEILYPIIISFTVFIFYIIGECFRYKSFMNRLNDSIKSPDYKTRGMKKYERDIIESINEVHKNYLNDVNKFLEETSGKKKFISTSIHNIKTSVSVIDFATECFFDEKSEANKIIEYMSDIKEENNLIKKSLDECLNIIRLDDFFTDYVSKSCNLEQLVRMVVNSKKRDFIYSKIFLSIEVHSDICVYTDEKWFSYMLTQVISNSIKFSNQGSKIEISVLENEDRYILSIKDYGIGIDSDDLTRVFEPFFTGKNGRENRNSTGIGLHMVNLISKSLGHEVHIDSVVSEWTRVEFVMLKDKEFFDI